MNDNLDNTERMRNQRVQNRIQNAEAIVIKIVKSDAF